MSIDPPRSYDDDHAGTLAGLLDRCAFGLVLVIVTARALMSETLRDPFDVMPGGAATPSAVGASATVIFNLLGCLPAGLVIASWLAGARRSPGLWPAAVAVALGGLAVLSAAWAPDRFAAAVGGSTLLSMALIGFAAAATTQTWRRLRIVAAVLVGLLAALATQGLYYRLVDYPDLVAWWQANKSAVMAERGWREGSFEAVLFERRVLGGEMTGFGASPNTLAAMAAMLMIVALGCVITLWQRERLDDEPRALQWAQPLLLATAVVAGAVVIFFSGTRTAYATPLLGVMLLGAWWFVRRQPPTGLAARAAAFWLCIAGLLLAAGAVIATGIATGGLGHVSLTFRWRYWLGGMAMLLERPWLGVGYDNFGLRYLAARLPVAAEEVRDPHNLLVRFAAELGMVGLALCVLWLGGVLWRVMGVGLSRAIAPGGETAVEGASTEDRSHRGRSVTPTVVTALLGVAVSALVAIDWSQRWEYATMEVFKRALMALAMLAALVMTLARVKERRGVVSLVLDDSPAPWAWAGIAAGLAVFFVHSMVDFAFFENGPMGVCMLAIGATIAMTARQAADVRGGDANSPNDVHGSARRRTGATGRLAVVAAAAVWLGGLVALVSLLVVPVVRAEANRLEGDDFVRAGRLDAAADRYTNALERVPWNSEYAMLAARAMLLDVRQISLDSTRAMLDRASAINPAAVRPLLERARFERRLPPAQRLPDRAAAAYQAALQLNPNDVRIRVEFAQFLDQLGLSDEAAAQYEAALRFDDQLPPDEIKRLPPAERMAILQRLGR